MSHAQNNNIKEIPASLGNLSHLWELDLSDNQLEYLPRSLMNLKGLKKLYLHGNPALKIPKSVLGPTWKSVNLGATPADPKDILDYYFRIQDDVKPLGEAKLLLVGFGGTGKTSVVKRLVLVPSKFV